MINKEEIIEESICKVDEDGTKRWYNSKGEFHRQNDLPAIEYIYGTKEWWLNGKCHRGNDKPAIELVDGDKFWFLNGKRHREKGPATIYSNGRKEWWWNYKWINVNSQEEFEEKLPYLIMKGLHEE